MKASVPSTSLPGALWARWTYALKPASWPKLLVPTLFGQVLGAVVAGTWVAAPVIWGLLFTVFGTGFIVLLNDWSDRRVDAIKREMFPDGCSPKTIPDRILSARSVGIAGLLSGSVAALVAAGSGVALGRPEAFGAGLACMAIFVAYSLPPVRLNYRGGGEFLEMVGVGVALPLYNAYLQAGVLGGSILLWVAGFAMLSLASATASGLSDEESDRAGGKKTLASVFGNRSARGITEACVAVAASVWLLGAILRPSMFALWVTIPTVAVLLWRLLMMRRISADASVNAFAAQGRYKGQLHAAIWHSTSVATLLLWFGLVVT